MSTWHSTRKEQGLGGCIQTQKHDTLPCPGLCISQMFDL